MSYLGNMATNYEKLGSKIRELRKETNLTQEQLAEKVNMDVRSIVEIESGKRNPTLKTLSKIAGALKIPLSDLLN